MQWIANSRFQLVLLIRHVWRHPLNSKGRIRAIWRVIRWQVASRLLPGLISLPLINDVSLFAKRGMTGCTGNWYCGLQEVNEMGFLLHVLRSEDHFLDIGANVGSYTLLASGAVGAATIAIEPIPSTFDHLIRNIKLNDLGHLVRSFQVGLSSKSGTLRFSSELDTVNHVLAQGEDLTSVEVPVFTLDEIITDNVPTIIKIDVEGHELPVLHGAKKTLRNEKVLAVIMETNNSGSRYGYSDAALVDLMRDYEFLPYSYDPFTRKAKLHTGAANDGNTIFIRNLAVVEERSCSAPEFKLINGKI